MASARMVASAARLRMDAGDDNRDRLTSSSAADSTPRAANTRASTGSTPARWNAVATSRAKERSRISGTRCKLVAHTPELPQIGPRQAEAQRAAKVLGDQRGLAHGGASDRASKGREPGLFQVRHALLPEAVASGFQDDQVAPWRRLLQPRVGVARQRLRRQVAASRKAASQGV